MSSSPFLRLLGVPAGAGQDDHSRARPPLPDEPHSQLRAVHPGRSDGVPRQFHRDGHQPPRPPDGRVHRALQPGAPALSDRIQNTRRPIAASVRPGPDPPPNAAWRRAETLLPGCRVRTGNKRNVAGGIFVQGTPQLVITLILLAWASNRIPAVIVTGITYCARVIPIKKDDDIVCRKVTIGDG